MATLRRGLPRTPGGEPWPPAGAAVPGAAAPVDATASPQTPERPTSAQTPPELAPRVPETVAEPAVVRSITAVSASAGAVRRGLPRVPGGEPWPPASATARAVATAPSVPPVSTAPPVVVVPAVPASPPPGPATSDVVPVDRPAAAVADGVALRRGLPRATGGEPWPPAGRAPDRFTAESTATLPVVPISQPEEREQPEERSGLAAASVAAPVRRSGLPRPGLAQAQAQAQTPLPQGEVAASTPVAVPAGPRAPLPFPQTVFPGAAALRWNVDRARRAPLVKPEPVRTGPFTRGQWAGVVIVGGAGLLFAAAMLVLAVRWFVSLSFMQDFLATFPGEYELPASAPVGIPGWIGWQHFFNVFLIVLIIRSGLQVRTEKRPTAFWSPRTNPKRKISLGLWFHQSLDILWLVNGVIFVVLLFVSGQWMRLVPTSWEVFPNALSAALQYVSLDWPTENGWVNYNSLQQLAYFATVFVAAPLAAITGVRMSGIWPSNAKALNRAYPVEWARAVHFPVMLYFVLFIFVHVVLVLSTGALRNLNHMYAAQGSVDPNAYAMNWTGFWIFVASLVVIAAGWVAARPLVLAPIARLFGKVSAR